MGFDVVDCRYLDHDCRNLFGRKIDVGSQGVDRPLGESRYPKSMIRFIQMVLFEEWQSQRPTTSHII